MLAEVLFSLVFRSFMPMFLGYNSPTHCYINEKINTSMKSLLPLPSTFYHKNIEDLVFNFNVQET